MVRGKYALLVFFSFGKNNNPFRSPKEGHINFARLSAAKLFIVTSAGAMLCSGNVWYIRSEDL